MDPQPNYNKQSESEISEPTFSQEVGSNFDTGKPDNIPNAQ